MRPSRRLLAAVVLAAACGLAHAQPASPNRALEALDALVRGPTLFLVDADGTTLRAIALDTGTVRFTAALGPTESAALIHDLGEGRLLVQTNHRFVTIDSATGAIVAARESSPGWKFVWRDAGACALHSECTFEPIDCRTGAPLGGAMRGTYVHRRRIDFDGHGSHGSASCESRFDVIGRAGDLSLYLAGPLAGPFTTTSREVVAIDDTGAVRWHHADVGCRVCATHGAGVSSDGSLCWTSDGIAESPIVVTAFACASGEVRFKQRLNASHPYRDPEILTAWVPGTGLLLLESMRARLFSPRGRPLWSRATARDVLVLPEGTVFPYYPLAMPELRSIEHVDARGTTLRTESVPDRVLRIDHRGHVAFGPNEYGSERGGGAMNPVQRFRFERASTGSRALLDGRELLALAGDAWALGELVTANGAVLVVIEPRAGRPDKVHVLRVGSAP